MDRVSVKDLKSKDKATLEAIEKVGRELFEDVIHEYCKDIGVRLDTKSDRLLHSYTGYLKERFDYKMCDFIVDTVDSYKSTRPLEGR